VGNDNTVTSSLVHLDEPNGRMGIGTSSPSYKLHVNGTSRIEGRITLADNVNNYIDVTSGVLNIKTNDDFRIYKGLNTGLYYKGGTDRVGIGTASPSSTLHVSGSPGSTATFEGSTQSTVDLKAGDANNYIVGTTIGDLSLRPSGSTAVTIKGATGRVGIGTTSPTYGLHVNTDAYVNDLAISSAGDLTFVGNALIQTNNNSFILNADSNANGSGFISLKASNVERLKVTTSGATVTGDLTVSGTVTAEEFHTEFVSASIVYESGSTKFGDTSDDNHDFTGSLNVEGNITLGATSPKVYFDDAQNHYIGYNNSTRLIFGLNGYDPIIFNRVGSSNAAIWVDQYTANYSFPAYTFEDDTDTGVTSLAANNIALVTSGSARVFADDSGNVGIGTTSPVRELDVAGDIELSGAIYGQDTDHTYLEIANSGYHHRFYTRTNGGTSSESKQNTRRSRIYCIAKPIILLRCI